MISRYQNEHGRHGTKMIQYVMEKKHVDDIETLMKMLWLRVLNLSLARCRWTSWALKRGIN